MQKSLRREDLSDRGRKRRPARLGADATDFLQHFQKPICRGVSAKVHFEGCHETGGEVVLRRANGDARSDGSDGLVADPLVDDVRRLPKLVDVDARRVPESLQRLCDRLAGNTVERECERVHGGRDQVRSRVDGRKRGREPDARGALDVEADREAARFHEPHDELLRPVRYERSCRIVHQDPRRAQIGQLPRLLDERVGLRLARATRAVDEAGVEGAAGAGDRSSRLAQVRDVVQRIVQTEDVDPVLRGARDEAAHDVAGDRPRADEETTAQRDAQRRRDPPLDRADPLPRTFDAATHGRIEDPSARHLETGEARLVEDLRHAEDLRRRQPACERLLREETDGRIDELRHSEGP